MNKTKTCSRCKVKIGTQNQDGDTGYAYIEETTDKPFKILCYGCCADLDRESMDKNGKIVLYFHGDVVGNWPGTLKFTPFRVAKGKHNFAKTRVDVWFKDRHGVTWHGVQYGENTELLHCARSAG